MRLFTLFCFMSLMLVACQPANKGAAKDGPGTTQDPIKEKVAFRCDTSVDKDDDEPHSQVFLVVNDEATKVADISACDAITKEGYNQFNIPANAIAACGGWWAGAGDYLYVVKIGNEFAVMKGSQDESSTEPNILYSIVATVPVPKN